MKPRFVHTNKSYDAVVVTVVEDLDRDVERGEDMLMLGLGIVMLMPFFAPIAPPKILLPLVAIVFAISVTCARLHYDKIERKLGQYLQELASYNRHALQPLDKVVRQNPQPSLADAFNPLKNLKRTWKSVLGGLFLNPFWFPIFYVIGMHSVEEKNFGRLSRALLDIALKIGLVPVDDADTDEYQS